MIHKERPSNQGLNDDTTKHQTKQHPKTKANAASESYSKASKSPHRKHRNADDVNAYALNWKRAQPLIFSVPSYYWIWILLILLVLLLDAWELFELETMEVSIHLLGFHSIFGWIYFFFPPFSSFFWPSLFFKYFLLYL